MYEEVLTWVEKAVVDAFLVSGETRWVKKDSSINRRTGCTTQYYECRLVTRRACPAKLKIIECRELYRVLKGGEHIHIQNLARGHSHQINEIVNSLVTTATTPQTLTDVARDRGIVLANRQAETAIRRVQKQTNIRPLSHVWKLGEIKDLVDTISAEIESPRTENSPIIEFSFDGNEWYVFVTSIKMLAPIQIFNANCLHMDFTFGVSSFNSKLGVGCCRDALHRIYPVAYVLCQRETLKAYSVLFDMIKKYAPCATVTFVMCDGFPGIRSLFNPSVRLSCFYHLVQTVETKKYSMGQNKKPILSDIRLLKSSLNLAMLVHGVLQFQHKWAEREESVCSTFIKTYINNPENSKWQIFCTNSPETKFFARIPSTNNPAEVSHSVVKRKIRKDLHSLKRPLPDVLRNIVLSHVPSKSILLPAVFKNENILQEKVWPVYYKVRDEGFKKTKRLMKASSSTLKLFPYYSIDDGEIEGHDTNPALQFLGHEYFEKMEKIVFIFVKEPRYWQMSLCSCDYYSTNGNCGHVVAISTLLGFQPTLADLVNCPAILHERR